MEPTSERRPYVYPPSSGWPTAALDDLVAVITEPGMAPIDAPVQPWPQGFGFDRGHPHIAAHRRGDVPADLDPTRVALFGLLATGKPCNALVSFHLVLDCDDADRVAREFGLRVVTVIESIHTTLVEPAVPWNDVGSPFDLIARLLAHPGVRVAEPLLLQELGHR